MFLHESAKFHEVMRVPQDDLRVIRRSGKKGSIRREIARTHLVIVAIKPTSLVICNHVPQDNLER
mgnify:CR=1 FL=1